MSNYTAFNVGADNVALAFNTAVHVSGLFSNTPRAGHGGSVARRPQDRFRYIRLPPSAPLAMRNEHYHRRRSRSPPRRNGHGRYLHHHPHSRYRSPTPPSEDGYDFTDIPRRLPASQRAECICPIDMYCRHKAYDEHDCRTLVPEFNRWLKRHIQRETFAERPEPDYVREIARPAELGRVIGLLTSIETTTPHSRNMRNYLDRLIKWIQYVRRSTVTPATLVTPAGNVHDHLRAFLTQEHRLINVQRIPRQIMEELTMISREWENNNHDIDFSQRPPLLTAAQLRNVRVYPVQRSAKIFGHNGLVNGQVFSNREAMVLAGAHTCHIAGICGSSSEGAYAVVMGYHDTYKNEYYADVDLGDVVWYMGTALRKSVEDDTPTNVKDTEAELGQPKQDPTLHTQIMMRSIETNNPIRLFRSSKLPKINRRRPYSGYRYDGLYRAVEKECLDHPRQIYRFKLVRDTEGQGEPR